MFVQTSTSNQIFETDYSFPSPGHITYLVAGTVLNNVAKMKLDKDRQKLKAF
jgi:hypothetical protein